MMDDYTKEILASRQAAQEITTPRYDPSGVMWSPSAERSPSDKRSRALADIRRRLLLPDIENNKRNPAGGWSEKEQRWYPHKSVEGGAPTIAYGVKLSNGSKWANTAKAQGYLTDKQAIQAVDDMIPAYYDDARKVFDKRFGSGSWDGLDHRIQSILTDYQYNVKEGLARFPGLMDAAYKGDIDGMLKESHRKQNRYRNEAIAKDIESLRSPAE